jgi:hypothetical protein
VRSDDARAGEKKGTQVLIDASLSGPLKIICLLPNVVGLTELESVTSCVSSRRSNQLSYKP